MWSECVIFLPFDEWNNPTMILPYEHCLAIIKEELLFSLELISSICVYLCNPAHEILTLFADPLLPINQIILEGRDLHDLASMVQVPAIAKRCVALERRVYMAIMAETGGGCCMAVVAFYSPERLLHVYRIFILSYWLDAVSINQHRCAHLCWDLLMFAEG